MKTFDLQFRKTLQNAKTNYEWKDAHERRQTRNAGNPGLNGPAHLRARCAVEIDGLKRNAQSTDIIALPAKAYANTAGRTVEYVQISWHLKIRNETRKRCKTMIRIHVFQKCILDFFSLTTKQHIDYISNFY